MHQCCFAQPRVCFLQHTQKSHFYSLAKTQEPPLGVWLLNVAISGPTTSALPTSSSHTDFLSNL